MGSKLVFRLAAMAVSGAFLVPASATAQATLPAPSAMRELVVDFDDSASESEVRAAAASVGMELRGNSNLFERDRIAIGQVSADRMNSVLATLRLRSSVRAADENIEMRATWTPNDPQLGDQWGMTRVHATQAWDRTCGRGVTVAVIDTGVACENHGEFTRLMDLGGTRCRLGYNFVNDSDHANDDQGHGTHVAGTIAQTTNNGFGVAGLAHCATILPVKVLDERGRGSLADVADGIRFAADAGAQVINLSLGGGRRVKVLEDAVAYARGRGAIVVCAAGNNGRYVESPGSEPGSFTVSALGPAADDLAYFSSRGPEVDIAAPGVNILQQTICNRGRDRCEQFASWSGTSMAAPHVAGVAALLVSVGVTNVDAIESMLRASAARPENGSTDKELYGAGVLDAGAAVRKAAEKSAVFRGIALLVLAVLTYARIRGRNGKLANPLAWAPFALFTSVGLWFLPDFVPQTVAGVALAMRPLGDWTQLAGVSVHQWLPLASALPAIALVALFFSRPAMRAPVGGFALGTASYLLGTLATGFHRSPLGSVAQLGWFVINALICLWIARIGLDRQSAKA
ncbi:MAG: S8 family peptidase [Deltaproteobacteria bacterium]|nr:S8 family peptidase [Deltaproteobacteria bacterium]